VKSVVLIFRFRLTRERGRLTSHSFYVASASLMTATITDDFDLQLEWPPPVAAVFRMSLCSRSEVELRAELVQTHGLIYQGELRVSFQTPLYLYTLGSFAGELQALSDGEGRLAKLSEGPDFVLRVQKVRRTVLLGEPLPSDGEPPQPQKRKTVQGILCRVQFWQPASYEVKHGNEGHPCASLSDWSKMVLTLGPAEDVASTARTIQRFLFCLALDTYQDPKSDEPPDFHKSLTPSQLSKFIARAKRRLSS
jgi:hypothetical protein